MNDLISGYDNQPYYLITKMFSYKFYTMLNLTIYAGGLLTI
jgi:hypothetical protein